jgi:endonuclease-8
VLELMTDSRSRFDRRIAGLGPDVLAETFDDGAFLRRLREDDQSRGIGDALLDQRNAAGIGNVWKSEACFAAGIDPWRRLADLSDDEARRLAADARRLMHASLEKGGHPRGLQVYERAGRACPRCGEAIRARRQGDDNRTTFWCPACQT